MRRFLSLCALLVLLLCAATMVDVAEARRRGVRIRGNHTDSGCARGFGGGTTACVGSSFLTAAAMLL